MSGDRWVLAALLAMATACSESSAPRAVAVHDGPEVDAAAGGVHESVTGGGQFVHPVFGTVTFAFTAQRMADGRVKGRFQQHQPAFGFTYKGDVTCFAVDPINHRAWIGGVVTHSNDPDPIALPGKDAWFRVLDPDEGLDRSTFLGFEGGGGILTSAEYCERQIWPEDNARTWPVEHGTIVLH